MRPQNLNPLLLLLLCGCVTQPLLAFDKKATVPATAAPAKTVKILVSRLSAPRVEETRPKKNAPAAVLNTKLKESNRFKESGRPVAVAKLGNKESLVARKGEIKPARNSNKPLPVLATSRPLPSTKAFRQNTLLAESKTKPVAVRYATELKSSLNSKSGKAERVEPKPARANLSAANLLDAQRKGKFGRENREAEDTGNVKPVKVTPHEPQRENRANETTFKPIRPRSAEESPKDSTRNPEPRDNRDPEQERVADVPRMPIANPDRIEVIDPSSPALTQLLALPTVRPSAPYGTVVTRGNTPPPARKDVNIPQQRIFEIQYELSKRGFYTAEPNGIYDDATVAAMWEFQKNYGLPATGYPTAHALKRLGLTSW